MTLPSHLPEKTIQPWRIFVTKAEKPCRFICLSKRWINFQTHWWGGHTIVCPRTADCAPCMAGTRKDFRAFVGGKSLRNDQYTIVSLTATACEQLGASFMSRRGMTGLSIMLTRVPQRDTGMLRVSTHGYVADTTELPNERLEEMLIRIFSMNGGVMLKAVDG